MHYIFWSFVDASLCLKCCALDLMQDQPKPTVALVPDSKRCGVGKKIEIKIHGAEGLNQKKVD